jgi:hypothetical protein
MIDRATGDLCLDGGARLGPRTRIADFEALAPSLGAAKRPSPFAPHFADGDEWAWEARFDGIDGPIQVTARFLNGWLGSVDLCCALDAGAGGDPRAALEALERHHARLLQRWGIRRPSAEFPWGLVNHCHADPWPGEDPDEDEAGDLIRIDYVSVPPAPVVRPLPGLARLAGACALAGAAVLAWAAWLREVPTESATAFDPAWAAGVALLGATGLLLLAREWFAAGYPGSDEEARRWPCPGCRRVGGFCAEPREKVSGPPDDFTERNRCTVCGATFSSDAMSYHPRLEAELPPVPEARHRWPQLEGRYRRPERFRSVPAQPPPYGEQERGTELRALILALEVGLKRGTGARVSASLVLMIPLITLGARRATGADWAVLIAAAVAATLAGVAYAGAVDRGARQRWTARVARPQLEAFLARAGMSREGFRARVAEVAGPESLLGRGMDEGRL